jgi:alpha-L-rhamnosidase
VGIEYGGKKLLSRQRVRWKVRVWDQDGSVSPWSEDAFWAAGLLRPGDWKAKWIGIDRDVQHPSPYLRREFAIKGAVRRATAYVTALGVYELHINGRRVGGRILAPEWTSYHTHVQYQAYDVTEFLKRGDNAIGAILGDGWYAGRIGLAHVDPTKGIRAIYGRQTRLLAQVHVELADGREQTILTDGTWKFTTDGPIIFSDILDGECYDARREMPGWDRPGFDDSRWKRVTIGKAIKAQLVAQASEPVRVNQLISPVEIKQVKPGVVIVNLGQEIAGWVRLELPAAPGRIVTIRHGERLSPDGRLYVDNLRTAPQLDTCICGGRKQVFEPHFTFHGFQYVEIVGLSAVPTPAQVTGCAVWSACAQTGSMECSAPMLNTLFSNILWTQRDNMLSVPTDCPQRDERCGWTGDIQVFAQTGCFNMDMAAFLGKWLRDLRDDQTEDGRYPDFAPHPFGPELRFGGSPAWGDAGLIVPWRLYQNYGDTRILAQMYDSAKRWVDRTHGNNPGLLWEKDRGYDYGDWLNADTFKFDMFPKGGAQAPKDMFATAFFYQSALLLAQMAGILKKGDDEGRYAQFAQRIANAFNRAYVKKDGTMTGDTQAGYAIALAMGLLPQELEKAAFGHMLRKFDAYGGHLSTGFISTVMLMDQLTRFGRSDKAYELINMRTFPSWGYTIDQGATTIWERWDGFVEGKGFQDAGMNSFCHYAIGAVGEWMYRTILGINPDDGQPGYKHFAIRPVPGTLAWAAGRYDSIRGTIAVQWQIKGGKLNLQVTIPPNTSATIFVPTDDPNSATEGGPKAGGAGLAMVGQENGCAVYEAQSGSYNFSSKFATSFGITSEKSNA